MRVLVGLAGYTGSGKTTAIDYLRGRGGQRVYLGQTVLDEVRRRGLPEGAESEGIVRKQLRESNMAALAAGQLDTINEVLFRGIVPLVDAIYSPSEWDYITSNVDASCHLLKIIASFEERCRRLAIRNDRPLSKAEVLKRDEFEKGYLRTDVVLEAHGHRIANDGTDTTFRSLLASFATSLGMES